MSVEDLQRILAGGEGEACGGHAVLLTMLVARNLGATNGVLFRYANSGDVTGDASRVVGYAAMGLYRTSLSEQQRKELLSLARRSVISYVKTGKEPEGQTADPRLAANGATFVTITRNHQLRGCIGNIQPVMPLYRSVIRNAVAASAEDPRFSPMKPEELSDMEVEVTVLSPLEPLNNVKDIVIGTHGLYLVKDGRSGVFLPQVPVEQGWDRTALMENLSLKAGLPPDAWRTREVAIQAFEAEEFGDETDE